MPIDSETDVEKVEIVRDEQDNVQRPANTAEQQATQGAIDAAKNELLSKLDTVGTPPIEDRGRPVAVNISAGETVVVPVGVAWDVSATVQDRARSTSIQSPSGESSPLRTNAPDDPYTNHYYGNPELTLHEGWKLVTSRSEDSVNIGGWEVDI